MRQVVRNSQGVAYKRSNDQNGKKNVLYLSVNVFSTKVLIGDTIFMSPTGDGTEGPRSSNLQGKGSTFISQTF